jgi:hypothetical protein
VGVVWNGVSLQVCMIFATKTSSPNNPHNHREDTCHQSIQSFIQGLVVINLSPKKERLPIVGFCDHHSVIFDVVIR